VMKQLDAFLAFVISLITMDLCAQNLVPDPSFENIRRLPKKKDNAVSCTKNWMCPMDIGAADYYHKEGKGHGRAPRNIFGKQKPHTGSAYGGICIRRKFMEYVSTKLLDTLIKDKSYTVEFYVSRAERSIGSVKEMGVLFSDKISMGISGVGIAIQPSVEMVKKHGFRKKKKWMKVSASYTAKGGETGIIIGHFNHQGIKRFKGFAHYYIDDVTVIPINEPFEETAKTDSEEQIVNINVPKIDQRVILKNIFFNSNESKLLIESYKELDQLITYLNELPQSNIEINGHTDNTGDEARNQKLSKLRAKAVADYLIEGSVDAKRIGYKGFGSSKPIASNDNDEGRMQNRRVEFILRDTK
jgi:OOP family OmpA-OmpF porin